MLAEKLKRPANLAIALSLLVASVLPVIASQKAHAYGLLGSRSIQLSSSTASATNTIYKLGYTTATTGNIGGLVVAFCSNSPIIGETTCTAPTGFDTVKATLALANQSGITGWSVDTTNSTSNILILTRAQSSVTAPQAASIDLGTGANGITNPSTANATYYARVMLYDTSAHAQAFDVSTNNPGTGNSDAGGIALSTAAQITITSKVQERLTFCVYTGANCGAGGTAVTLGDNNGVLDPLGAYVDKNTKYDLASNASSGVTVRIKGDTLKTGSFSITPNASATASSAGSEQFGFCTYQSAGSGLIPDNLYDGDSGGTTSTACTGTSQSAGTGTTGGDNSAAFAFDSTNTNTTYGQAFATKAAGSSSTGVIAFIGNISNTTEAGIYATTLTFVATGSY